MTSTQALSTSQSDLPPYTSHNSPKLPTILFIHGAGVTGANYEPSLPYLTNYHILLPTLPSHGTNPSPLTLETCTTQLANLIRSESNNGTAHVVGLSMGSHIAIHLANQHPYLVLSAFVSGFGVYRPTPAFPFALWGMSRLESCIPTAAMKWAMDGTAAEDCPPPSLTLCKAICRMIGGGEDAWPKPWKARTLIVCAGKGGIIPTADPKDDAVRLAGIGRSECGDTRAVIHYGMRHPWNRQDPELFAKAVMAWIEERQLPEGFAELKSDK